MSMSAQASHERPSLLRLLLVIAVFALLGPLLAALPVYLAMMAIQIVQQGSLLGGGQLLVIIVGAAYLGGWIYAAATGVILALSTIWRRPDFATLIGSVVLANIVLYFAGPTIGAIGTPSGPEEFGNAAVTFIFSLFAATMCWLIGRRFLRTA